MADFFAWLFVAVGGFAVAGGALDLDFFMESRKARLFVRLLGRNGARVFYVLLGAALVTLGICALLGVVKLESRRWG